MTDRTQFEAMLNALINENQDEAKEIFHNIVVAKSREIYEQLLAEDFDISEESEEEEEEEESQNEAFGDDDADDSSDDAGDDEEGEEDDTDIGGDASDDFIDDTESDDNEFGDEEEGEMGEDDLEDRVMDLEDALEDLKAEFDELMAGEENEPEHSDMFGGEEEPEMGDEFGEPEMGDEFGSEPAMGMGGEEEPMDEFSMFMEYVNKVALPKHGDDGANTKSIVAKKNDMGGTTTNIAKSFSTEKGGTQGGLLNPSTKEENFGNINVPGGNAGKSAFKKKEPGHGAEKKGTGEKAADKNSLIGSRK